MKSKYCFEIYPMTEFYEIPKINRMIVFESFGRNGGFGIMWLGYILVLRRPDSQRIIPTINKEPIKYR